MLFGQQLSDQMETVNYWTTPTEIVVITYILCFNKLFNSSLHQIQIVYSTYKWSTQYISQQDTTFQQQISIQTMEQAHLLIMSQLFLVYHYTQSELLVFLQVLQLSTHLLIHHIKVSMDNKTLCLNYKTGPIC